MVINVRDKGKAGEREVVDMLNGIIYAVMKDLGYPETECLKAFGCVQRNQNQTAVGGNDLSNTFGLSFEVKRQEALAINSWWQQCVDAAKRNSEWPVLIYRQNKKPWRVVTLGWLTLPDSKQTTARVEMDIDTFRSWFRAWILVKFSNGEGLRT